MSDGWTSDGWMSDGWMSNGGMRPCGCGRGGWRREGGSGGGAEGSQAVVASSSRTSPSCRPPVYKRDDDSLRWLMLTMTSEDTLMQRCRQVRAAVRTLKRRPCN